MEDIILLDAVERYLRNEMSAPEKTQFENLRNTNAAVDQLVVEHHLFLNTIENYSTTKKLKQTLNEVETSLTNQGLINIKQALQGKAKIFYLWKKYKRTAVVAASIAGFVSLITVGIGSLFNNHLSNQDLVKLSNDVKTLKEGVKANAKELNEVKIKIDPKATFKSGGTGFLIDGKGYLITNLHVLKGKTIIATNNVGQQFVATICMKDDVRDIAILKIEDKDFKSFKSLPYNINKTVTLAEPIFTLGYPKDEIVYGEGYLSSKTGYKSDTLTYQININADHGNSGGPILNKNGDVIGILTDKVEGGSVFAIKSYYIYKAVENLKKDSLYSKIKLSTNNEIKGLNREQQVKKVNDCVFLIKSYE